LAGKGRKPQSEQRRVKEKVKSWDGWEKSEGERMIL